MGGVGSLSGADTTRAAASATPHAASAPQHAAASSAPQHAASAPQHAAASSAPPHTAASAPKHAAAAPSATPHAASAPQHAAASSAPQHTAASAPKQAVAALSGADTARRAATSHTDIPLREIDLLRGAFATQAPLTPEAARQEAARQTAALHTARRAAGDTTAAATHTAVPTAVTAAPTSEGTAPTAASTAPAAASAPFGAFAADRSLGEILFLPAGAPRGPWREATPAELFGEASTVVPPAPTLRSDAVSLTENAVFQSFVLLLAMTYATLLYRNIGDIRMLFAQLSRERSARERLAEDPGSSGFTRFLHLVAAIGMLFLGVVAVKYGDVLLPHLISGTLPHGAVLALSLLVTLACTLIVLLQALLLRTIGALTVSQGFIARLLLLRRSCFALTVLVTAPVLLLFALCPRNTGDVWFVVITIELAIAVILYFRESLQLFISKKISILNWILYLCGVEIFPFSLLWLLLVR